MLLSIVRTREWPMAPKEFKGGNAKSIDVGCWCCTLTPPLLRCGIWLGEGVFMCIRGCCRFRVACDPEIRETPAALVEQNVLRFQVTVHDTLLKASKGFGNVDKDAQ